jgi:hypothetical protein
MSSVFDLSMVVDAVRVEVDGGEKPRIGRSEEPESL